MPVNDKIQQILLDMEILHFQSKYQAINKQNIYIFFSSLQVSQQLRVHLARGKRLLNEKKK